MPYFTLLSLAEVTTAVNAVSTVQGAYQAVSILTRTLSQVEEPEDFATEVQKVENEQGPNYDGPEDAGHQIVKALKTASNSEGELQTGLVELASMVVTRLGFSQGTRVVSILLLACGIDPTLTTVVLKLCVLLSRTETGQKILSAVTPKINEVVANYAEKNELARSIQQTSIQMGESGVEFLSLITRTPLDFARKAIAQGGTAFLELLEGRHPDPTEFSKLSDFDDLS